MRASAGSMLAWTDVLPTSDLRVVTLRAARLPLLVFLGYYLGARLGFALTFEGHPVSMFWAPNAVLMAAFILAPVRSWWMVLAGALPAHLASQVGAGVPPPMILLWFVSNSVEGLLGAVGVRTFARGPAGVGRLHSVGVIVVFAGFLAPFLSSFLDAGFVRLMDWQEGSYWDVWTNRFFANVLAALTVVPVVLAWAHAEPSPLLQGSRRRLTEAALIASALLTASALIYGGVRPGPEANAALLYAPLPFLVWATIRFGPLGGSTTVLAVVLLATWNTVHGRGPFISPSPELNALSLQLLFIVLVPTLLALAAVLEERRRAVRIARSNSETLHLALNAVQMGTLDWTLSPPSSAWTSDTSASSSEPNLEESVAGFLSTVHPGDRERVEEAIRSAIAKGGSYHQEFRVVRGDGSTGWVLGKGKVLRDEEGRITRVVGIQLDVNDKKAADALTAAENRILGMIASEAPLEDILTRLVSLMEAEAPGLMGSVLLLDPDGVHIRHGAAPSLPASFIAAVDGVAIGPNTGSCGTAMYLGYPVISSHIQEDPLWADYRDLATSHALRACWSTPILSQRWNVMGSFAIYSREPREPTAREMELLEFATHLAGIAIERKRAEEESQQQQRELTHLGRVATLGGFSGALAHELSQPLASILSNAQAAQRLLRRDPPEVGSVREILADIVSADLRASEVIERLRAMLANHQGERSAVDMNRIAVEALQLAGGELRDRRVQVDLALAENLPAVLGDPVQLEQVVLNLIANACDAMNTVPPAERRLRLTTQGAGGGSLHFSIEDHGVGVPAEIAHRIGDPFVTSKPSGLGLGLSISRSIIVGHGGQFWFENNADGGAVFHITLPSYDVTTSAERSLEIAAPLESPEKRRAGAWAREPARGGQAAHSGPAGASRADLVSADSELWQPLTQQGYVLAVT